MDTPKSRCKTNSSLTISPQSEVFQKNSPRAAFSQASKKSSPRVVREIKVSPRYAEPTASSSNLATKPPKEGSPKVSDRRSPRNVVFEKKGPSRVAELESQISQLENDLKNVKDQLCFSETSRKQARKEAEESNEKLLSLSVKLEETQKQIVEQPYSEKLDVEQNQTLQSEQELASALDEIKRLKVELEMVAESKPAKNELHNLQENLAESRLIVEKMKNELNDCKNSEAEAKELVGQTLMQLETAKKTMETLRSDGCKATETYEALAFELEQSRARVDFLEELVSKLKAEKEEEKDTLEVEQLKSALEVADIRYAEEQSRSKEEIKIALEMVEKMKSESGRREAELEAELRKSKYEIEELRANMMDKENELQCICEENDSLIMQLGKNLSRHNTDMEKLKTSLMDKEIECENLASEIKEIREGNEKISDLQLKIGFLTEEVDKSNKKVERVMEQLEAAQKGNTEMEADFRRLKVQSDQWRKAAEVAAAMLSTGNNGQLVGRTGSMDGNYTRRISSPYGDDLDEDLMKKKNANVLSRFGVLWKKPQK